MHQLTTQGGRTYELLTQLDAFNNAKVTSVYDKFEIGAENEFFRLKLGNLFQDGSGSKQLKYSKKLLFTETQD